MSEVKDETLAPMLRKLRLWVPLEDADEAALLALPHKVRSLRAGEFIVREDDKPKSSCLMLDGFSARHKVAGNGGRQIFSIHLKGDIVDLHNSLLETADHNVQMLEAGRAAFIPIAAIQELATERPLIGKAMWYETLVDAAIFREWALNVGRRDARTRMAHMLCEFALRLETIGMGAQSGYELPMTQDQLADTLALTAVHVNRTLMALGAEGFITRTKRSVNILDWHRLAEVGDFDSRYLHLDRGSRQSAGVEARQLS